MSFLILGCNESKETALRKLAPGLDPDMASALVAQDTTVWDRCCTDAGLRPTLKAAETLRHAVLTSSEAAYLPAREHLQPYVERVERSLRTKYKYEGEWTEYEAWLTRSYQQAKAVDSLQTTIVNLAVDTTLTYQEKLARFQNLEAGFRSCNSVSGVVLALEDQAHLYGALKADSTSLVYFRKALAERDAGGRHTMTMSLLTTLGFVLGRAGYPESTLVYYNRAIDFAEESQDPVGTWRGYKLLASYYQEEGQFATANELLMHSAERCRELKSPEQEFFAILSLLSFQARFGAWDRADEFFERAEYLRSQTFAAADGSPLSTVIRERMALELGYVKGPYLMDTGQEKAAEQLFTSLRAYARRSPAREGFAHLLYVWSTSLLHNQRPEKAVKLAHEGLAYAAPDSANLAMEAVRLDLVLAEALGEIGHVAESKEALQQFRELAKSEQPENRSLWLTHDRILVSLALASGNKREAEQDAVIAMARLERLLSDLDQSAQACLFLDENRPLREAIHKLMRANPEAGYGFEMAWRGLYRRLGSNGPNKTRFFTDHQNSLITQCATLGRATEAQVARTGSVHTVYFAASDSLLRWTASAEGLQQDVIPGSPSEIKRKVAIVLSSLGSEDEIRSKSPELMAALTDLASLLPTAVHESIAGGSAGLFLLSPDLYLSNLPFEAINIGGTSYRPLIESWDVAYLRHSQLHPSTSSRSVDGLVLSSPSYPPVLLRRYPFLKTLPYGAQEAALVTTSFPGSISLSGRAATKTGLKMDLEMSGFIYVSSHFIQDSATPYMSFLPLAAPDTARISDALLNYGEIREANLSNCNLVVLSGCATGTAYTNEKGAAPSLGDAFLDAGARQVIHTRWRVEDQKAYDLSRTFIRDWSRGESPVVALNRAQRDAWRSARQPSATWTSYSVSLSQIPSVTNGRSHASNIH